MNRVTFTEVCDRMTGQWQTCLEAIGVPPEAFEKGNHPCVFCGGTDRANYGNRQHPETYYCRQCADRGLDGFSMLQEWHGWTTVEALQAVAGWLGMGYHDNVIPFTRARPRPLPALLTKPLPDHRDHIRRIWQEAVPLTSDAARVARAYFDYRGLAGLPAMPRDVRCHLALPYWWRNPDGEPVPLGTFPALVSLIRSIDGRVKGLHRTYLQPDGRGKVRLFEDGERVQLPAKKTVAVNDGSTRGCAVHLFPMSAASVLAIAEGIETALAVTTLWGVPCWSVLSASNLERFELPPGIQEIAIFTDADENGAGQYAGKILARRVLAMESPPTVRIATPTEIGTDWLDYLNSIVLEEVSHG